MGQCLTKLVSNRDTVASGLGNLRPAVELLTDRGDFGVVAEEGVEGSQSCPSIVTY